jgi:hypothetical protein
MSAKPVERDVASLEYVKVDVTADVDPTGDPVYLALQSRADDTPTFHTAEWAPGQTWQAGSPVTARVLIGPGGGTQTLTKGTTYKVKVKVTDNPEVPVFTAFEIKGV